MFPDLLICFLYEKRNELAKDIKQISDSSSAVDWFGSKDAPVALKLNLVISEFASGEATTIPEIAVVLIEYLQDCGY